MGKTGLNKRLLSLLCAAALLVSLAAGTIGLRVLAADTDNPAKPPAKPNNVVAMLDEEGFSSPTSLSERVHSLWYPADGAVDLKDADYLEFDIYMHNYTAFQESGKALEFWITSNADEAPSLFKNRLCQNATGYVTQEGWNHVKVPLRLFGDKASGTCDTSAITGYCFFISQGLTGAGVTVANFCATKEPEPAMPADPVLVLDQEGLMNEIGGGFQWVNDRISRDKSRAAGPMGPHDLTAKPFECIEFDVFIEDLALCQQNNMPGLDFYIGSGDNRNANRYRFSIADQITRTGWNHVRLDWLSYARQDGTFDQKAATTYMLAMAAVTSGTANKVKIGIKNLCLTNVTPPPPLTQNVLATLDAPGYLRGVGQFTFVQDRLYRTGLSAVAFADADYLELDLYVSDLAKLQAAGIGGLQFNLGSNATSRYSNRFAFNVLDQVKQNGWNHIRVAMKDGWTPGGSQPADLGAICTWMIVMSGKDGATGTQAASVLLKAANICATAATGDPLDTKPAMPKDPVAVVEAQGLSTTVGSEFSAIGNRIYREGMTPMNLSGAIFLEFDLYVEDMPLLVSKGLNTVNLSLSSSAAASDPRFQNRGIFSLFDTVKTMTKNSWKHVKLRLDAAAMDAGGVDWKSVRHFMLSMDGAKTNGAVQDVRVALTNICVTGSVNDPLLNKPAMPANPVVVIDEEGLSTTTGTQFNWINDRAYRQELGPMDLSGAAFLELDVYVGDMSRLLDKGLTVFNFCLSSAELTDAVPKPRYMNRMQWNLLDFAERMTEPGWVHVKLPLDGGVPSEGGLNMKAVRNWMFVMGGPTLSDNSINNIPFSVANICVTNNPWPTDTEAPVFASTIRMERAADRSITLSWDAATDNQTLSSKLAYTAYYATAPITAANLSQAAPFASGAGLVLANANRLKEETAYYFAVTVRDEAGNQSTVYTTQPFRTTKKAASLSMFDMVSKEIARGTLDRSEASRPAIAKEFIRNASITSGWYNNIILRHTTAAEARDISGYNAVTFDLFVSDGDKLAMWQEHLYIVIQSGLAADNNLRYETFLLKDVALTEGWNTVTIDISAPNFDPTNVSTVYLATFPLNITDLGWYPPEGDCAMTYKLANVRAVDTDTPAYTPTEMQDPQFLLDGDTFVFMKDYGAAHEKMRSVRLTAAPVDISGATHIEFDFYVGDLEALKANEGFVSVNLRILTDEGLSTSNNYVQLNFTNQLTRSGWNHVRLLIEDGVRQGTPQLTACRGVYLFLESGAMRSAEDVKLSFYRVYVTRDERYVLTPDPDQPSRPDKDAVYITDCESLIGEGAWNPADISLDTDHKTEGLASIRQAFSDKATMRSNSLRFTREEALDLTGAKTLQFDLWINDPELLRQRAKVAVRLYGPDSQGFYDYMEWAIDQSALRFGWNAIEIDLTKGYAIDGEISLGAIQGFNLLCTQAAFGEDERVTVKLDNIRVFGAVGGGSSDDPGDEPTDPDDSDDPTTQPGDSDEEPNGDGDGDSTKTGDSTRNLFAAAGLALCAALAVGGTVRRKAKRQ